MKFFICILTFLLALSLTSCSVEQTKKIEEELSAPPMSSLAKEEITPVISNQELCLRSFDVVKDKRLTLDLKQSLCKQAENRLSSCLSNEGLSIFHFDKRSKKQPSKNILVFASFHGDEPEGAVLVSHWVKRLNGIDSRNNWRILPIMNPDGIVLQTRTNARGVDLNRNFPTKDWDQLAMGFWKSRAKSSPRRFPGEGPASEPETRCAVEHIKEFNPDFVISIHTPYGILDFDGPSLNLPNFAHLRWYRLGNYPGSLGRFMWKDRNIPVLTVELKSNDKILDLPAKMDSLQDLSGKAAILVEQYLK
jgi:hypothetical protein